MSALGDEELLRYARQVILPQIGAAGQEKLKAARVLIAGIGGLGCLAATYLAAAGIGNLTIVDHDTVAHENLNRQVLHHGADIGTAKVDSAARKLKAINPFCRVRPVHQTLQPDNALDLAADAMLIVDATDNIAARKVLNRAAIGLGIPLIYGGVNRFQGTVSTLIAGQTPCFECLFPNSRDKGGPVGVIGPAAAMVGAVQSLEAIKIIIGMDGLLTNRMLSIDGRTMTIKTVLIARDPDCPACGGRLSGADRF